MRHAPFTVDQAAHDAWLLHMRTALDELGLAPEHEKELWRYLTYAAGSMVNTAADGPSPSDAHIPEPEPRITVTISSRWARKRFPAAHAL